MTPLIRIFSPRVTFGPGFGVLVLGNSFIPRLCSQSAHWWDVTQCYSVSSKGIIPVEVNARLLW